MSWFCRVRNIFRAERVSEEIERELRFHVAERADKLMAQGMSESEALREARKIFGNYSAQKEGTRGMDTMAWLEAAWGDVRYGLRQLRQSPGFTTVAVLSLALGIGANAAIFQLIDAIRLRGLPVERPSELASLGRPRKSFVQGSYSSRNVAFTYAQIEALSRYQQAFSDFMYFHDTRLNMSRGGRPRYAEGLLVSDNFLRVLGLKPIVGRDLPPGSNRSCEDAGVLVSYAFWQSEFGGDMKVLGKAMTLEGQQLPVIGVMPPGFYGVEPGHKFDLAVPLCADQIFSSDGKTRLDQKMAWWLAVIGRMKPGWTVERTSKQLRDISPAIFRESLPAEYRASESKLYITNKLEAISAVAGVSSVRRNYGDPLTVLMCITGLVLAIACANLANLLLAKASARGREIAVRQALGATRVRLIAQMLWESVLLSFAGAFVGMFLAQVLTRVLVNFLRGSGNSNLELPPGIDWHVFAFTGLLACLTCLLFGFVPALRASASTPANAMRGSRTSTATRERNGLRRALVVSQVALSLVLLVAALLFTRSLQRLFQSSLGFEAKNVLVATVSANTSSFAKPEYRRELFRDLDTRLRQSRGVSSSAAVNFVPLGGFGWNEKAHADVEDAAAEGKFELVQPERSGLLRHHGHAIACWARFYGT